MQYCMFSSFPFNSCSHLSLHLFASYLSTAWRAVLVSLFACCVLLKYMDHQQIHKHMPVLKTRKCLVSLASSLFWASQVLTSGFILVELKEVHIEICIFCLMGVSKNRGTPKCMVHNGKPYQNGWFGGTPIFGNTLIMPSGKHFKKTRCAATQRPIFSRGT